jgi:hypothetical protein
MTNSDNSIVGMAFAEGNAQRVTFGSQTNHPVTFLTNDTERMRITSGGNLGIGSVLTTLPTTLTVKGNSIGDGIGKASFLGGGDENTWTAARNEVIRIGRGDIPSSYYHSIWSATGGSADETLHWLKFYISNTGGSNQTLALTLNGYGDATIGRNLTAGAATFSGSVTATTSINAGSIVSANQGFYTTNSLLTVPFTTWTEIKAIDSNIEAMYLFVIGLTGQASSDWSASGILITGGGSDGRWIVGPTNGTYVQLRISGTSVQVYQNGTSPNIGLSYKMLRIG